MRRQILASTSILALLLGSGSAWAGMDEAKAFLDTEIKDLSSLDRAAQEVKDSDLAHSAELLDDEEPRQRRDGLCAELSAALLGLRDTLTGLYGADTDRKSVV